MGEMEQESEREIKFWEINVPWKDLSEQGKSVRWCDVRWNIIIINILLLPQYPKSQAALWNISETECD